VIHRLRRSIRIIRHDLQRKMGRGKIHI